MAYKGGGVIVQNASAKGTWETRWRPTCYRKHVDQDEWFDNVTFKERRHHYVDHIGHHRFDDDMEQFG